MAVKQRTPFIKPRVQGGTFYTFGSALEDIGLNINETNNKVSLSHYVLLDIPYFGDDQSKSGIIQIDTTGRKYSEENKGDLVFADYFQDAILNMETVLRNNSEYNYASPHTVSERVFWKWLFKDLDFENDFTKDGNYFYQKDAQNAYAKSFGRIVSGAQRVDSEGIYNETFVQIPSSYGQMRVLFKQVNDENFSKNKIYNSSNGNLIEGIKSDEFDENHNIISTGIPAWGRFDGEESSDYTYHCKSESDQFEVEFDLANLTSYYDNQTGLTYDDIGFGNVERGGNFVDEAEIKEFRFNSILVYYSIYDTTGKNLISTNAFGIYVLGNTITAEDSSLFLFPEYNKIKTSNTQTGTSFSFRLNIKPTSAYSGDIVVSDNSTTAFAESTDFNDVIKNLSTATEILKTNARVLNKIVNDNLDLKNFAKEALEKVDDISKTVSAITTDSSIYDTLATNNMLMRSYNQPQSPMESIAEEILKNMKVTTNMRKDLTITIEKSALSADALSFADSMVRKIDNKDYIDLTKIVGLLIAKANLYRS